MGRLARNGVTPQSAVPVDRIPDAQTALNITADAVITDQPARLARISVLVAGTTPGSANDCTKTTDVADENAVAAIPNEVGVYEIDWPCLAGIVITPGTGQTVAVAWY